MYTKTTIEEQSNCKIHLIARDIGYEHHCQEILDAHMAQFGRIDILVNNAAEQHKVLKVEDLVADTVERTFRTNGEHIHKFVDFWLIIIILTFKKKKKYLGRSS